MSKCRNCIIMPLQSETKSGNAIGKAKMRIPIALHLLDTITIDSLFVISSTHYQPGSYHNLLKWSACLLMTKLDLKSRVI